MNLVVSFIGLLNFKPNPTQKAQNTIDWFACFGVFQHKAYDRRKQFRNEVLPYLRDETG